MTNTELEKACMESAMSAPYFPAPFVMVFPYVMEQRQIDIFNNGFYIFDKIENGETFFKINGE